MRVVGHQGLRSPDPLIKSQRHGIRKAFAGKDLRPAANSLSAHLQRAGNRPENAPGMLPDPAQKPALSLFGRTPTGSEAEGGVERVVAAWRRLPRHIKAAILTLVEASSNQ